MNIFEKVISRLGQIYGKLVTFVISTYYYIFFNEYKSEIFRILNTKVLLNNRLNNEQEEQAFPNMEKYFNNGYFRYMFGRYFFCTNYTNGKKVLEVGSGLGWGTYILAKKAESILAIDVNERALEISRNTFPELNNSYQNVSALNIKSLNSQFECIIGMELIEHLSKSDGIQFLSNCLEILTPGGYLILSSYFPLLNVLASRNLLGNQYHLNIFTHLEIRKYLKKIGFKRIRMVGDSMVVAKK